MLQCAWMNLHSIILQCSLALCETLSFIPIARSLTSGTSIRYPSWRHPSCDSTLDVSRDLEPEHRSTYSYSGILSDSTSANMAPLQPSVDEIAKSTLGLEDSNRVSAACFVF